MSTCPPGGSQPRPLDRPQMTPTEATQGGLIKEDFGLPERIFL